MMPGMPGAPRMSEMYKLMQRQTDSLAEVPSALTELQRAVRGAADTLTTSKETVAAAKDTVSSAKDTVDAAQVTVESAQRSAARIEAVIDELEEPVRALRLSIERLNAVLGHPAIERLPATLELVESAVVPFALGLRGTQDRWAHTTRPIRDAISTLGRRLGRRP